MGTTPGDVAATAAALKAKLDALIKDAEEAEEKAVAARRRARATRTPLEEEEQACRCRCSPACAGLVFKPGPHVAVLVLL
jgi:hypothetical protein